MPKHNVSDSDLAIFASKWATHFAKHGTGYYEHLDHDQQFVRELTELLHKEREAAKHEQNNFILDCLEKLLKYTSKTLKRDSVEMFIFDARRLTNKEEK